MFFQQTMSRLYYEHFGFLFFENSLNRPGGEMTDLPRVLADKFLVFWLGGGCLRDLVVRDECVTVYKFVIDSFVQEVRRGH